MQDTDNKEVTVIKELFNSLDAIERRQKMHGWYLCGVLAVTVYMLLRVLGAL